MEKKINLNVDVIHKITSLSKVGRDPVAHFFGKSLDRKLVAKMKMEHKATKGMRTYDSIDIQDHALRFYGTVAS